MVFHSSTGGSSYRMTLPASECSRSGLPSGTAITRRALPKDSGCLCPPAVIASPSSAPDSASAASLLIRRTLSNDVTGDPARILRRFSAGFGSTAAGMLQPDGSPSSRTRRAAAVLPEPGGPENSIAGVWWCTQNMWQRCAQKRGRCHSRTRSRAQNASSHPRLPVRAPASRSRAAPSPRARPGSTARPVRAFWRRSRTGGGDARPGPPTGCDRQSRRASRRGLRAARQTWPAAGVRPRAHAPF